MRRLSILFAAIALISVSTVEAQEPQIVGAVEPTTAHMGRPVYRQPSRRFFRRSAAHRPRRYTQADRIRDVRTEQFTERFPRFIGGFHYSHFTNVGVPNGDIGFRGNGIYWTPW